MKRTTRWALAVAVLSAAYVTAAIAFADSATRQLLAELGLPVAERSDVEFFRGGTTGIALAYEDTTAEDGTKISGLATEFDLLSPLRQIWTFDAEADGTAIEEVFIKGTITPWNDKGFDLASASVATIRPIRTNDFIITGIRTRKSSDRDGGPTHYLFEIDAIELGNLDANVASAFGTTIRDMRINATRTLTASSANSLHPPETYIFDWRLGSWGPMQLQGEGQFDLDGEKLSRGEFVVSVDGVTFFVLQQAFKKGVMEGVAAVLGGIVGAACFTESTGAGLTALLRMDSGGIYLQPRPLCQNLGAFPLAEFDEPIAQDDFYRTVGKVFY